MKSALVTLLLVLLAPLAPAQDYDKFVADFRQAMAVSDGPRMESLVKANSLEAVWHIDKICTAIGERPSEELEREAQALMVAWRAGRETGFADNYYAYLSLMRAEDRRERNRFKGSYQRSRTKFDENAAGAKDGPTYAQVAADMEGLAKSFTTLGDHYSAGQCWATFAACFNEGFRDKKEVDLAKVTEGYANAVASWDKADLKFSTYVDISEALKRLTAEGWKDVVDNVEGATRPGEPKEADPALAVVSDLSFEAIEELDQFQRPNYMADEIYQMWQWMSFGKKDSSASFHSQKGGPTIYRSGAAELGLDGDGDGQIDTPIKLTGNFTTVECEIQGEGPKRGWAFTLKTGIEEDTYQGLAYHMAPQDAWMNAYFVAAGSMVGTIGETEVRFIDENMDGNYGSLPWSWEYLGLTPENYHWESDSMVVGSSKRAVPWSQYANIGKAWYKLEMLESGTKVSATPVEVETGKLKLSFKGPSVNWLIVKGQGRLEYSYYDVMSSRGGVEVPIGRYSLLMGEVRKGKKAQTMKALILPGADTPEWTVEAGKTTTIELGGPFGFDFKTQRSGDGVTVVGKSVVVTGKAGERYERPWNCVSRPDVAVRKAGAKKGNKPETMEAVMDMLAMDGDGGFKFGQADAWFPLDSTFQFVGEDYEVQLTMKKNPLFGKLESAWK